MDNKPLLSIAIPTWNRAKSLESALQHLLPQADKYNDVLEIIISDNGSTDSTQDIIEKYSILYPKLLIINNRNEKNIGFYGNFKKCRELAEAKYIWILSDDDFILSELIETIISTIIESSQMAFIYLKHNSQFQGFDKVFVNGNMILNSESYRLGFISSIIFLNSKNYDEELFVEYNENAFIGLIFTLNSLRYFPEAVIIRGNCFKPSNDKPKGYNYFKVFVQDMQEVVSFASTINIDKKVIDRFQFKYLTEFLRPRYIRYKLDGIKVGDLEYSNRYENNLIFLRSYYKKTFFWLLFFPLICLPASVIRAIYSTYKKIQRNDN